jgi:ABC-type branched-subunit amino acid transport system ATPase component
LPESGLKALILISSITVAAGVAPRVMVGDGDDLPSATAIVLVEQSFGVARADRFPVLQRGEVIAAGSKADLRESQPRGAVSV